MPVVSPDSPASGPISDAAPPPVPPTVMFKEPPTSSVLLAPTVSAWFCPTTWLWFAPTEFVSLFSIRVVWSFCAWKNTFSAPVASSKVISLEPLDL